MPAASGPQVIWVEDAAGGRLWSSVLGLPALVRGWCGFSGVTAMSGAAAGAGGTCALDGSLALCWPRPAAHLVLGNLGRRDGLSLRGELSIGSEDDRAKSLPAKMLHSALSSGKRSLVWRYPSLHPVRHRWASVPSFGASVELLTDNVSA